MDRTKGPVQARSGEIHDTQKQRRPRVVVIGGGFGGLEVTRALRSVPVEVTLVDQKNHHCFQPLLYQVATAALSPAEIAWPIRSILSGQLNAAVVMAKVMGIDMSARLVLTNRTAPISFDFLILASGATHSYFGHDEWAAYAPGLKRVEDATEIRRRLLFAFEMAEIEPDARRRERLLTFVVIGGGPTGVELAGAIAELSRFALAGDFRHIDPRSTRVVLVEAGERILPAFDPKLSANAAGRLRDMGVDVRTSTRVTDCGPDGIATADGRSIEAGNILWAAGVRASPAAEWIGCPGDRAGRIEVDADLSVPGRPGVFAIGDTALVRSAQGTAVPGIAPAAKQMGRYVGKVIAARVSGASGPRKPFRYRHYGDLATIGRKSAVVQVGRFRLTGLAGWLFWSVVHIYFLIGARNRIIVATEWVWDYFTLKRGARLIGESGP